MLKKMAAAVLAAIMLLSAAGTAALAAVETRDTSYEETLAYSLRALGLFQGVSDTDFDLNRAPSRGEAVVMLIRLLGKEKQALKGSWSHPFKDVPAWASKYIGYAYENGLAKGVSTTKFGFNDRAAAHMYLTFVLRALGYSDQEGADFIWYDPYGLAEEAGLLPPGVDVERFWRADVVLVSYAALGALLKGTGAPLYQRLIEDGVFTQGAFAAYYKSDALTQEARKSGLVELTAAQIFNKCSPAVFLITAYDANGFIIGYGSGFFIDRDGTALTSYINIAKCYGAEITTSDTGETYRVKGVYGYEETYNWAVIKVEGSGFPYLKIGDDLALQGGETVYTIGNPYGLQNTLSAGLVSNPRREYGGRYFIQTSAAYGGSGSVLMDSYGRALGIAYGYFVDGQNLNLVTPLSMVDFSVTKKDYIPMPREIDRGKA